MEQLGLRREVIRYTVRVPSFMGIPYRLGLPLFEMGLRPHQSPRKGTFLLSKLLDDFPTSRHWAGGSKGEP